MKNIIWVVVFAASLFAFSPICRAQDCSNLNNWDLRGIYAFSGSGWMDFSKLVPTMPAGTVPMAGVGVISLDGIGGGTGWTSANSGGIQMTNELVNLTYQVKPNCSVVMTFSIKVKELGGATIGPMSRVAVISRRGLEIELLGILVGAGPGMPVEQTLMRRFSMDFK